MGRKIRRFIAILLCVTSVMILCMPSESSYASVQVGDYEIDGDTLIKYTGTGDMITLPNTIRKIGKDAFSGNTSLLKVIIPDSVRDIDFAAFENCTGLMQVVIPESVKSIGSSAFSGCEQLQYINIPSKCRQIGSAAFAKCGKLATVSVSPGNDTYVCVDGVLYSKDGKKVIQYLAGRTRSSYNMPSTVESIEEYSFWGAGQLADLSLSSKLKEIPEYAFANCSGLNNVVLPYNVESLMAYSFSDCYNLRNVIIPDSVGYVDEKAFYLTDNVTVNYYDSDEARKNVEAAGVPEEDFAEYIGSVSSNSYDISVSGSAGEKTYINQAPYVNTTAPDYTENKTAGELASGKIVGGNAMIMLPRNVHVYGFDIERAENEDGTPYIFNDIGAQGDYSIINGILAKSKGNDVSVTVPSGIKKIGNRTFYKKGSLKEVNLPSGIDSIGDFAFARSGIERIEIPEGTNDIGYAAFYNCGELKDVSIPDSVERIELGAFEGTPWLNKKLNSPDGDYLVVGDGILLGYGGNGGSISIPNGVKTIAPGCFRGNTDITGVILPQGLKIIGEDAFDGCRGLTQITLPDSVTDIEDRAFKDCSLKQVIIPENVQRIGLAAFDCRSADEGETIGSGAVVFLGRELPRVSYKNTATRLSAKELRKPSLSGFDNVIIGSDTEITEDSILSESQYGFRGQVYSISSDSDDDSGTLRLIRSASDRVDAEGNVTIDPHVVINDKRYIMTGVSAGAFEPYYDIRKWTDKNVNRISIAGNTSRELNTMLKSINEKIAGAESRAQDGSDDGKKEIKVNMDPSLSPDKEAPLAAISGTDGNFRIDISDASHKSGECLSAFADRYGSTDILAAPLDISMYDETTGLPITRLSGCKVDIELPIPGLLTTAPDISVGAINDNGVLQEISSEIVSGGRNDKIRFVAPHFSTYVFYVKPEQTAVLSTQMTENMAPNKQSAVIRTLNRRVGVVEIKWYIAVILLSMAAILFLYKGKRPRSV